MKFIITSVYLDIKGFYYKYIKSLFFLIMFSMIIGIFIMNSSKIQEPNYKKIHVAVVNEDTNLMTEILLDYITSDNTFSKNFDFSSDTIETAKIKLKESIYDAIIIIPENFLNNIMYGKNEPFTAYLGRLSSLEAAAFEEILKSAAKYISSSQVGIYATLNYLRNEKNVSDEIYNKGLTGINMYFYKVILGRKALLNVHNVSPSGRHSIQEYYLLSFIVMKMLLYSVLHVSNIHEMLKQSMILKIKSSKLSYKKIILAKLLYIFLINLVIFFMIFAVIAVISNEFIFKFNLENYLLLLNCNMIISLFSLMCSLLFTEKNSCYMFILVVTLIMTFISGGFIPSAFLPELFDKLKFFTLNHYCVWLLSGILPLNTMVEMLILSVMLPIFMMAIVIKRSKKLFK